MGVWLMSRTHTLGILSDDKKNLLPDWILMLTFRRYGEVSETISAGTPFPYNFIYLHFLTYTNIYLLRIPYTGGEGYQDRNELFRGLRLLPFSDQGKTATTGLQWLPVVELVHTMLDTIYTIEQAAEVLHIKPRTLREWIRQEKVKAFKLGGLVRIHEEDLQEFIDSARKKARKTE